MEKNKLQAKDLINVGIFTAIYFVLFFAGMMLGYIPIFIPLLGLVCPIICGIPFMLYLTKVKKFGMVTLSGIILGLLNMLIGSGVLVLIFGIVFGVAADLIMKSGKYKSWKFTLLGNGVFSLWIMGFVSRMFLTRTEFFDSLVSSYGQEYVDTLMSYTPGWMFPVLFKDDFFSVPEDNPLEDFLQTAEETAKEGSDPEQVALAFICKRLKLNLKKLSEEEKKWLKKIAQKSDLLKNPNPQRGRK